MAQAGGRRVVVTGGSGGIGSVVVARLAAEGDRVVNLDRAPYPERPGGGPDGLLTISADLAEPASLAAAFAEVDRHFAGAPPDVLVCCAAVSRADHFLDVGLADLDLMLRVNVRGTLLACQEAGRRMRRAGRGHIVVITSKAAAQAWAGESVYCATKAAQASLVQCMAIELAPFGILVNAVAPGIIDVASKGMAGTRQGEVFRHEMEHLPLGRFGKPEEIAETILFLSRVTWMTGQAVTVDGGYTATGLAYFGARKDQLVGGGAP